MAAASAQPAVPRRSSSSAKQKAVITDPATRRTSVHSPGTSASDPNRPETWTEPGWATGFQHFKDDGEVHRDHLCELLKVAGERDPPQELVESIVAKVASHPTLAAAEVYEFLQLYKAELRADLRLAFYQCAQNNGKVNLSHLETLVFARGYTPMPHCIKEVMEEASADVGSNSRGGTDISLNTFERVIELLEYREGFSKSQLNDLMEVFRHFDKNENGVIDAKELRTLMEWLDFCLNPAIIESIVAQAQQESRGVITWEEFLVVMRKRTAQEYALLNALYKELDTDGDSLLQPGQFMRLFAKLGVSILPETLAEVVDQCEVDGDAFDFPSFWKVMQVLRKREGFTVEEAQDIRDVFNKLDWSGNSTLPSRRVPVALDWLGYQPGPGVLGKTNARVGVPNFLSYWSEAQVAKLARRHREAELKAIRRIYCVYSEEKGAGNLSMENLMPAVKKLSPLLLTDCREWVKSNRPGARLARKQVFFDFEDFRTIVLHCRAKLRERIARNCGFSEVQLSRLRIEFVKYAKDGKSMEVTPKGLVKLFQAILPLAQTSMEVRERLKKALEVNNSKNSGLDWHGFLRVMRTYEELTEEDREQRIQEAVKELAVRPEDQEDVLDWLSRYDKEGAQRLNPAAVQTMVRGTTVLSLPQAEEVLNRVFSEEEEQNAHPDGTFGIVRKAQRLKEISVEVRMSWTEQSDVWLEDPHAAGMDMTSPEGWT